MTGYQKQAIQELRAQGLSYLKIAKSLNLSANTVKSFCQRNALKSYACKEATSKEDKEYCKHCGQRLNHTKKAKPKTFCRDTCRRAWWNDNRELMNRKAIYHMACVHCGRPFESYGNKHRKYCSHPCYINGRFGKEKFRE